MLKVAFMRERSGKHAMPVSECVMTDRLATCRPLRRHTCHLGTRYQAQGAQVSAAACPLSTAEASRQLRPSDSVDYSRARESRWVGSDRAWMTAVRVGIFYKKIVTQNFAYVATNAA
jgi:hypothetical protein